MILKIKFWSCDQLRTFSFKQMVRVWKTKSPLTCLRDDSLTDFWRQNHVTFIFIKTMSHSLLVQVAYWQIRWGAKRPPHLVASAFLWLPLLWQDQVSGPCSSGDVPWKLFGSSSALSCLGEGQCRGPCTFEGDLVDFCRGLQWLLRRPLQCQKWGCSPRCTEHQVGFPVLELNVSGISGKRWRDRKANESFCTFHRVLRRSWVRWTRGRGHSANLPTWGQLSRILLLLRAPGLCPQVKEADTFLSSGRC